MDGASGSSSAGWPLFERQTSKRNFSAMADNSRSTSPDALFVSPNEGFNDHHPPPLALPTRRTRYRGFDFRRPIMSENSSRPTHQDHARSTTVIDLTEDDSPAQESRMGHAPAHDDVAAMIPEAGARRMPRYAGGRHIIDVEDDEGEEAEVDHAGQSLVNPTPVPRLPIYETIFTPPQQRHPYRPHLHPRFSQLRRPDRPSAASSTMDDIEFVEERRTDRATTDRMHAESALNSRHPRSVTPYPSGNGEPIDLTADDDDVEITGTASRAPQGGVNMERPGITAGTGTRSILPLGTGRLQDRFNDFWSAASAALNAPTAPRSRNNGTPHIHFATGMVRLGPAHDLMGLQMDFETPAFNMGYADANPPPEPKYEPPLEAEPGFTRSPGQNEEVVCPNCGDELAIGDNDIKQQIWVVKKCGHAYCGMCAQNRSKGGKGKAKVLDSSIAPKFSKCVVEKCGAPAMHKSMVQVYLGS